jgi:phosphate transport system permease protein
MSDLRKLKDLLFRYVITLNTLLVCVLLALIILTISWKSMGIFDTASFQDLFISKNWDPESGEFGFTYIILGTFYVTAIAMLIAIPISILSAIYIAEYAGQALGRMIKSFMDVLASVPSVVFGMCAIIVLVPLVAEAAGYLGDKYNSGLCVLSAGVTLGLMVCPIIISICVEAIDAVPSEVREASLSVGASKWETTRSVVVRGARPGIFSAILLGFGRAFGETMAVAMVIGYKVNSFSADPFQPSVTIPALILMNYGELMSQEIQEAAIMTAALLLCIIVITFNVASRIIMRRAMRRWGYEY